MRVQEVLDPSWTVKGPILIQEVLDHGREEEGAVEGGSREENESEKRRGREEEAAVGGGGGYGAPVEEGGQAE